MLCPSYLLLHVAAPSASQTFYERLLGIAPVESSSSFVLFAPEGGPRIGLWKRDAVVPAAASAAGAAELGFAVAGDQAVQDLHAQWLSRGVTIAQPPTRMDFGFTFTALDPDGHRLRVFAPAN